jgi:hypothetical protein
VWFWIDDCNNGRIRTNLFSTPASEIMVIALKNARTN